ncbi:MAG: hypothetical protein GW795_02905 [Cyanobacteria bacterium]|nr:hypothetical protein [Cyanobacteria bacterium CG_2015-16_32_12]NCO79390.1 hypothetical protein [Cyanobacteria bacterium CG_2015-22_32_23]NCQ40850.1 hypothetical protein [Cyanobacteria bacterium CG_2015-04_32_10]NCS85710.1 hypothetical protein [Cyanobacteria bacterium CG_2015-02_32_10]
MNNKLTELGISQEDYCVFGLATCFIREEGEIKEIKVIEPIPSAALEALFREIPTSYQLVVATTIGKIIVENTLQKPQDFPLDSQFCDDFINRTSAATRTYKSKPSTQEYIKLGASKSDFNYSLERKRVLNNVHKVSDDDNVKQHSHTHKVL